MTQEWCSRSLRRVVADLSAYEDGRLITVGSLDAALNQLQIVYRELVALDTVGELNSSGTTAIHLTASAIEEIRDILESHPS